MKNPINTIITISLFTFLIGCVNEKTDVKKNQENPELVTETTTDVKVNLDDYMYITASSGLSLREFNNLDSEKLAVIPYGTKVKIINIEEAQTMNVAGIKGGMNEVEYNNKKGFAFNGYLSTLFPPEKNGQAEQYITDLKATHAAASYKRVVGGTASNPTENVTIILPTNKWHEAFSTAQRLFHVPTAFTFPNPKGRDVQTISNPKKPKFIFMSDLKVERATNALEKITYYQSGEGYGATVTITKVGDFMRIESANVAD